MYAENTDTLTIIKDTLRKLQYNESPTTMDQLHSIVTLHLDPIVPPISETVGENVYEIQGGIMDPSTTMIIIIYYDASNNQYIPHLAHNRDTKIDYTYFKMFGTCESYGDASRTITQMLSPLHIQDCFSKT